jgi:hypothetical protein
MQNQDQAGMGKWKFTNATILVTTQIWQVRMSKFSESEQNTALVLAAFQVLVFMGIGAAVGLL